MRPPLPLDRRARSDAPADGGASPWAEALDVLSGGSAMPAVARRPGRTALHALSAALLLLLTPDAARAGGARACDDDPYALRVHAPATLPALDGQARSEALRLLRELGPPDLPEDAAMEVVYDQRIASEDHGRTIRVAAYFVGPNRSVVIEQEEPASGPRRAMVTDLRATTADELAALKLIRRVGYCRGDRLVPTRWAHEPDEGEAIGVWVTSGWDAACWHSATALLQVTPPESVELRIRAD